MTRANSILSQYPESEQLGQYTWDFAVSDFGTTRVVTVRNSTGTPIGSFDPGMVLDKTAHKKQIEARVREVIKDWESRADIISIAKQELIDQGDSPESPGFSQRLMALARKKKYGESLSESELFIKRQRNTRMITPISKDLNKGLFVKRAGLRHLFNTKRWHHGLEGRRFHHKLGRFLATRDTTSSVNESNRLTGLVSRLNSLKYELARAAQKEYDAWSQDEEGFDWEVGTGGICNQIAEAMADVINDKLHGAHAFTDGSNDMNHTWVFVCNYDYDEVMDLTDEPDDFELVEVDIPYSTYETGGGYNWKKIPNVRFDSSDVEISKSWTGFRDYKYMLRYESADTKAGALLEQLEMSAGVRVSHNPSSKNAVIRDLKLGVWSTDAPDSPLVERLRWLLDTKSGDLFIWDGYHAIHKDMAGQLGLNYRACVSGFIKVAPNGDWSISKDTLVWDRLDQNDGDATPEELAIVQRAIS